MIYETIVTSMDAKGIPHVAPFGIREQDGLVAISPFRPSTTLDNFLTSRVAVVNFTDDVRVFAGALTGRSPWTLSRARKVDGFILDGSLAHQELELVDIREDSLRPQLLFKVVHEEIHLPFKGFNRAQAAVIELAILVSRLHMLPIEKITSEIDYLKIAIEKTAGTRELQAWGWLMERVENHKAQLSGENQA
ncbi:MAG TPA: DUF447 domain-containing protein [Methylophilaceae bacterium]|nr:DUF447 domain-containing protein [Methylophilaceae bacterium]